MWGVREVPSANSHEAAEDVMWAPSGAQSIGQTCVSDDGGISAQRERGKELVAAGVHSLGLCVCVCVQHVVDTVFDRTSSDYDEVNAMCPNETVLQIHQGCVHTAGLYTELQTA